MSQSKTCSRGTPCVACVATLVGHRHAHVDDGQSIHPAGSEAKDVLDHHKALLGYERKTPESGKSTTKRRCSKRNMFFSKVIVTTPEIGTLKPVQGAVVVCPLLGWACCLRQPLLGVCKRAAHLGWTTRINQLSRCLKTKAQVWSFWSDVHNMGQCKGANFMVRKTVWRFVFLQNFCLDCEFRTWWSICELGATISNRDTSSAWSATSLVIPEDSSSTTGGALLKAL